MREEHSKLAIKNPTLWPPRNMIFPRVWLVVIGMGAWERVYAEIEAEAICLSANLNKHSFLFAVEVRGA